MILFRDEELDRNYNYSGKRFNLWTPSLVILHFALGIYPYRCHISKIGSVFFPQ